MLYNYEKSISDMAVGLGMKSVAYADDEDIFTSMVRVLKYPVMWYQREQTDWALSRQITAVGSNGMQNALMPFRQDYTAHFLVETQEEALRLASRLRRHFFAHPYVPVRYSEGVVDVAVYVTSITVGSQRGSYDAKGSQREVVVKWWSQLFFESPRQEAGAMVEGFRICLLDEEYMVYDAAK